MHINYACISLPGRRVKRLITSLNSILERTELQNQNGPRSDRWLKLADLQLGDMCRKLMNRWLSMKTPEDVGLDIRCTLPPPLLKPTTVTLTGMGTGHRLAKSEGPTRREPQMYVEGPNVHTMDNDRNVRRIRLGRSCMQENPPQVVRTITDDTAVWTYSTPKSMSKVRQMTTETLRGLKEQCKGSVADNCFCWLDNPDQCACPCDYAVDKTCIDMPRLKHTDNGMLTALPRPVANSQYTLIVVNKPGLEEKRSHPRKLKDGSGLPDDS